jgi:hypothetical protein
LQEGFQSRQALLEHSLASVQQRQGKLGELLLHGQELGFQTG